MIPFGLMGGGMGMGLGVKLLAGLALVAVSAGGLSYAVHAIESGGMAKAELQRTAEAAQETVDSLNRLKAANAAQGEALAASTKRLRRAQADRAADRAALAAVRREAAAPGACRPGCTTRLR